ncbi:hypothetical protein HanXRQr2_Chr02g0054901 [Helianthus annuus]|uniref:Uncharacterized protein n=1 Tax=Helianthus annuus TaxID=4232 RepID=A0A9K3JM92_HELAN|nr:hypothetical protein HanXRQr2_Chr02g0054901 [Helianthus annuus]KAJ0776519.1 hypothetical protein HanLR1_Chr02g0046561 [Helianthus annuus]
MQDFPKERFAGGDWWWLSVTEGGDSGEGVVGMVVVQWWCGGVNGGGSGGEMFVQVWV